MLHSLPGGVQQPIRPVLVGRVKNIFFFQETIISLMQEMGCIAEVANASCVVTFLSSNPDPLPSFWAHFKLL